MIYAYFIDNTNNLIATDNSKLFKYLQSIALPDDCIVVEQAGERVEAKKLFDKLEKGDILIVRSLCDLGDKIHQVLRALEVLADIEVELISICEDYFTISNFKQFIKDLFSFDCELKKRARIVGYETAKEAGKVGRPKNEGIEEALRLYDSKKFTVEQVCKMTSVSQSTLYRALRDRQVKINKESSS